ncbi:hypothetical protein COX68_00855 [Candidatus Falkowbacteria bacterium CG_4_10_14_0_2_um_filter_41_15]|uniref:Uncharacterized protein n=4 Tax=Candidatus Falkowiibacteriota TaxID=1752728 RepID=A0A2G9ZNE7_9BACT|nr:MAG: hypothetical protein AUJ35_03255 [Candidatus Falkowbacteria bacterium CG1_02_41_21]PIP34707.1 MAG: hypothetical protein COX21_01495 [Candidatus Falkowbacteria bacterium CG23_combo_of_CG06-09_8_20_14_all_41_10]PIZ11352.1 MAG: hypothetical protein COY54_00625 [Candidatus Falkowbacteria bacterium CG_4_10_14_0_8_um_filter_41_36]PJA10314.1 MAG: hypothetical protein COX68_00855 [Candidatus Falkowbacteria bacterium CG_4_10_14_0_2_um_filter_41_15]
MAINLDLVAAFKNKKEENNYVFYTFSFSKQDDSLAMRRMLLTMYLATYYVVEQMFYHREFFSEGIWDDQAFSFVIFDGGGPMNSYSLGGQLYPWFKTKLGGLNDKDLGRLNESYPLN